MNLIRRPPAYPKDRDLSRVIQAAAARLVRKFEGLDPHSLDLSQEACALICQRREGVREEIERCAHVFAWALPRDEKPFSDLSLVAFADRLGLFALLARECSIGTVVCHNAEGADVDDASTVAKAIGSAADHYVFGDLEDLEFVLRQRGLSCDVFVSRDALGAMERMSGFFGRADGSLSLGLGYGGGRPFGGAGSPPHARNETVALRCRAGLSAIGFEMSVIRSGCSLLLIGSRRTAFAPMQAPDHIHTGRSRRPEKVTPRE